MRLDNELLMNLLAVAFGKIVKKEMFRLMMRVVFVVLGCVCSLLAHGQCFSGELATELHWNMKKKVNWTNQLRLNLSIPLWNGSGSIEASTLHMLRTNETIIDD